MPRTPMQMPTEDRWWCPDCDKVLNKPRFKFADGSRFHRQGCITPMRAVTVRLAVPDAEA